MAQHVFILYNAENDRVVNDICKTTFVNSRFFCEKLELDAKNLCELAGKCPSEYFFVISTNYEIIFDREAFDFKPPEWDKEYLHYWNCGALRLYNKELVLANPEKYTDKALYSGNVALKKFDVNVCRKPIFDIIYLSYDETFAADHFKQLSARFPRAKHVAGVKGIYEAHKAASVIASTDMFYVVDADAILMPDFNFDYNPHSLDKDSVHVWHSKNPINDLIYGYGGVKLFPTKKLREYTGSPIDFTTSVSDGFKVMEEVSNITKFNTDPFSTWRSAFRECTKLASGMIKNQNDTETEHRLEIWCTVGAEREFGDFALMGANEGREFGVKYANHPDMLRMINDYSWLEERFSS